MAKNKYKTSDLLAMSFQDMSKLTTQDLKKAVAQLGAIANKRATRLSKSDVATSSALVAFEKSGGKVSVAKKTQSQLRREFARTQKFLNAKTSTITGAKRYQKETSERLGVKNWNQDQWKTYWNAYEQIVTNSDSQIALYRLGSDRLQQMLRDEILEGVSPETIIETASDLSYEYDRQTFIDEIEESVYNEIFGDWGFFD